MLAGSEALADATSPEVGLLLRRPDNKRDVAVLPLLLPDVKGRSFQHVSVHRHHGSDKVSSERQVSQVGSGPGRVLVPGDGLAKTATVRLTRLRYGPKAAKQLGLPQEQTQASAG